MWLCTNMRITKGKFFRVDLYSFKKQNGPNYFYCYSSCASSSFLVLMLQTNISPALVWSSIYKILIGFVFIANHLFTFWRRSDRFNEKMPSTYGTHIRIYITLFIRLVLDLIDFKNQVTTYFLTSFLLIPETKITNSLKASGKK